MPQPFPTEPVVSNVTNYTHSPDTSYLRSNIAVPVKTLGRTVATVLTNADTRLEDVLPSDSTVTALLAPADALE